jgi:hypothetical protein
MTDQDKRLALASFPHPEDEPGAIVVMDLPGSILIRAVRLEDLEAASRVARAVWIYE